MSESAPTFGPACETNVITVISAADRFWCAAMARTFAERAGLSLRSCWEVAIAVSELVSNAVKYAGAGEVSLVRRAGPLSAVEVEVRDLGPGISNPQQALLDGYTEHANAEIAPRGLRVGLGAVHRLMSCVEIHSTPGRGTTVRAIKWEDGPASGNSPSRFELGAGFR